VTKLLLKKAQINKNSRLEPNHQKRAQILDLWRLSVNTNM